MRLGLIGLGRIGAFHAATLTSLDTVDSLVVHDQDPAVVNSVVERHASVETARTVEALLASGVDGVVIAAATGAHPELILASLAAGLPTFCEKPVSKDMAAGAEILRQTLIRDVPVQIGYPRRFDRAFVEARRAVTAGELGFIHTVRSTTLDPAPPSDAYVETSGGIFRDCSVHDFDAVRFVTGQEVVDVLAVGSNQGSAVFARNDDVDTAATILTLGSGTLAVVSNSRYNGRGHDVRFEVHGSRDSVAAGIEPGWPIRSTEPGATFPGGTPHVFFMDRFADAFRRELNAFTEVVAGTIPSPCTVAEAVEVGWIAEAATLSLHQRQPIRLDDLRDRKTGRGLAAD
ncbi:myo-inositol 2-dehydrogenase / D-chiro-inositol 1-dehydrogenase [Friedmanniella luteola]|uniref:Myo-inositol 2-dehydrogenase / D-chiro-inositol 1-dehydrogenase n=1 Tax=Friedmanniella luteola TaxID=546871 RepID=A0A1H1L903_9ACTN|nr:Gfo/Idh/MocA family oxidoreductase [Friedmanniella luteola]SDR70998.1 myo-inositol 2-dehydrogenase / D-chiro-inositol 1-dehydrogenase [Friedmanniella luteola]